MVEDDVLFDIEGTTNARFGSDVAAGEKWAVVGAPGDDDFRGAAIMWGFASLGEEDGLWIRWGKLKADVPYEDGQFGKAVAVSGDVAVVGSPFWATDGYGAAYVFRLEDLPGGGSAWTFEQRLTPTLANSQSNAGWSVAVSGDVVVVGAYYSPTSKVHVYRFDGESWVREQQLPIVGTGAVSVAVSGDVIGVDYATLKAFRYDGGSWEEEDDFGNVASFDLRGDRLLVGDSTDDVLGENAGAAIVYEFDGSSWVEEQTLRASDGAAGDLFGTKVSLADESRALIFSSNGPSEVGSGYVFDRSGSTWTEIEKLESSDSVVSDQLGSGIAVTNRAALMGAPWRTRSLTNDGVTYSWLLPAPEPSATLLAFAALTALGGLRRAMPRRAGPNDDIRSRIQKGDCAVRAAVALVFASGQRVDEGVAGELIAVRGPAPIVAARRAAQADTNPCRPSAASRSAPPEARFQKLGA